MVHFHIFIALVLFTGFIDLTKAQIDLCPSKQYVVLNKIGKIKCSVPNVQGIRQWKIIGGNEPKELDTKLFQVEPDGLIIKQTKIEFNGQKFQLDITNPVTGTLFQSKVVEIIVNSPPIIKATESKVIIENAEEIGCTASGTPKPTIRWVFQFNESMPVNRVKTLNNLLVQNEISSFLQIQNITGLYQCIASNGIGSALDSIVVLSENNKEIIPNGIKNIEVINVTDDSVLFQIDMESDGTVSTATTHVNYMYILYSENDRMKEEHTGSGELKDGKLFLTGFPKGISIIFHFANDLSSTNGLTVTLLPPTPQIAVKTVTKEQVTIEWRLPWAATYDSTNGVDFYELRYSDLSQQSGELVLPPSCTTEIKIPSCLGNRHNFYRRSTLSYSLVEVRSHNPTGYSPWSSLLLA